MKNEDNSFSVLAAIVIAGVILACFPPANSSDLTNDNETSVSAPAVSE